MRTIKSSREFDSIFRESRRYSTPLITALIRNTPEGRGHEGRVAFVAGKRIGGAVIRNRSKRVMREAVRRSAIQWPGHDVLLIANARTGLSAVRELDEALAQITRRSGVGA